MFTQSIDSYYDVAPGERLVSRCYSGLRVYRFRRGCVPGISCPKGGHYFRHPKTLALLREAALDKVPRQIADDTLMGVPKLRQKSGRIPTLYDDVVFCRMRSWKKHRKTQWK